MAERIPERVFVSYSRQDERWMRLIESHLKPLADAGEIELWIDKGRIETGDRYNDEIAEAIDTSSAAILLVSPWFQASEFIRSNELPRLRGHADSGKSRLFWVRVADCDLAEQLGGVYHNVNDSNISLEELEDTAKSQVNKVLTRLAADLRSHVAALRKERAKALAAQQAAARQKREKARAKQKSAPKGVPRWMGIGLILGLLGAGAVAWMFRPPFANSLGMQFVPVPGTNPPILMSVWETRVQDYAAFAAENPGIDMEWKDYEYEGHKQGPDHPVVGVSWEDAKLFCEWLSRKEGRTYRS